MRRIQSQPNHHHRGPVKISCLQRSQFTKRKEPRGTNKEIVSFLTITLSLSSKRKTLYKSRRTYHYLDVTCTLIGHSWRVCLEEVVPPQYTEPRTVTLNSSSLHMVTTEGTNSRYGTGTWGWKREKEVLDTSDLTGTSRVDLLPSWR